MSRIGLERLVSCWRWRDSWRARKAIRHEGYDHAEAYAKLKAEGAPEIVDKEKAEAATKQ